MLNLDSNNHSVFMLYYHTCFVLVSKYRRKVLDDEISQRLKEILEYIASFWSRSFCLLTAGGAPLEVIRKYIESQGESYEQGI